MVKSCQKTCSVCSERCAPKSTCFPTRMMQSVADDLRLRIVKFDLSCDRQARVPHVIHRLQIRQKPSIRHLLHLSLGYEAHEHLKQQPPCISLLSVVAAQLLSLIALQGSKNPSSSRNSSAAPGHTSIAAQPSHGGYFHSFRSPSFGNLVLDSVSGTRAAELHPSLFLRARSARIRLANTGAHAPRIPSAA